MPKYMNREELIAHWEKDNVLLQRTLDGLKKKHKDCTEGWPMGDKLLAGRIDQEIANNNKRIRTQEDPGYEDMGDVCKPTKGKLYE